MNTPPNQGDNTARQIAMRNLRDEIRLGHEYTRAILSYRAAILLEARAAAAETRRQHQRKWAWAYLLGVVLFTIWIRSR